VVGRALPEREEALRLFKERFLNRTDLVAILAPWGKPCPVEANGTLDDLLLGHLLGESAPEAKVRYVNRRGSGAMKGRFRVGSYCPGPNDTTRWLCLDFDGAGHADALADPQAAAVAAFDAFTTRGLPAYLERSGSGKGWHLWCFFDPPIAAEKARRLGHALAPKNAALADGSGEVADPRSARGIEVFPKQPKIRERGFGNLVWLPWWTGAADGGNTFYRRADDGSLDVYVPAELATASAELVEQVITSFAPPPDEEERSPQSARSPSTANGQQDPVWVEWRERALAALSVEAVYGQWLTGEQAGAGWLQCRDPSSPTGDQNPSASVADGTGDAERGAFHSFISGRTISVFDFLVEHCGLADFRAARERIADLTGVAQPAARPPDPTRPSKSRPEIQVNNRQLRDIVADSWSAVRSANTRPYVFLSAGAMVRLAKSEDGPRIDLMDEAAAYGFLARIANWVKATKDDFVDTSPSKDAARDMIVYPSDDLPPLEAVVTTPVFDGDGRLVSAPGYHRGARLWYFRRPGFDVPPIDERPTLSDVAAARALLVDELLGDFPFVDDSDRAHMLAALLLPFARRLISGITPLHLIEAPTAGSGKGLLVSVLAAVTTGEAAAGGTLPEVDEEVRKKITSELVAGRPLVIFDNADNKKRLDSASLASVLTMPVWKDRLLGQTRMVSVPNRAVWVLTGNNLQLTTEIARRCIRVRIDPRMDRPWLRSGFRHPALIDWAQAHRGRLVHAALTLIQHWLAQGRPRSPGRLGSFERWSDTVGGILAAAGVPGFLGNLESLYEAADAEGGMWREFVTAWWEKHGEAWTGAGELLELVLERDLFGSFIGEKSPRSQKIRLGKALSAARDRVFAHWRIVAGRNSNAKTAQYRLVRADTNGSAGAALPVPGGQLSLDTAGGSA
jgi:hypothetical protein